MYDFDQEIMMSVNCSLFSTKNVILFKAVIPQLKFDCTFLFDFLVIRVFYFGTLESVLNLAL